MASSSIAITVRAVASGLESIAIDPRAGGKWFMKSVSDFQRTVKFVDKLDPAASRASLRALFISMPAEICRAMPAEAIQAYDDLIQQELQGAALTDAKTIPQTVPGIAVWQGDMSRLVADAVVNPCNNALLGCFLPEHKCLDNILHGAAGPRLRIACHSMLEELGLDEDANGNCRVTTAYGLPSKFVFHTVGPCLVDMQSRRNLPPRAPTPVDQNELRSCYDSCLAEAVRLNIDSLAFCCISTGIFGYPAHEATAIAIDAVMKFQERSKAKGIKVPLVIFNVFKDEDLALYSEMLPSIAGGPKKASK